MSHQIHTYTDLRKQIHDDLRIQHPEWVEPNGESSMCLLELLDTFTRKGSNESVAAIHRVLHRRAVSIQSSPHLKLPAHVLFRKDLSLMLWKPHGILDEVLVNEMVAFIDVAEERASKPFNRFADLSALDMVDLNFKFVFYIGLHRHLASAPHSPVKSAFYVTSPAAAYYAKLYATLTDNSTLDVALFTEREAATKWLDVPVEVMMALR
jgi:hypothetical protein